MMVKGLSAIKLIHTLLKSDPEAFPIISPSFREGFLLYLFPGVVLEEMLSYQRSHIFAWVMVMSHPSPKGLWLLSMVLATRLA